MPQTAAAARTATPPIKPQIPIFSTTPTLPAPELEEDPEADELPVAEARCVLMAPATEEMSLLADETRLPMRPPEAEPPVVVAAAASVDLDRPPGPAVEVAALPVPETSWRDDPISLCLQEDVGTVQRVGCTYQCNSPAVQPTLTQRPCPHRHSPLGSSLVAPSRNRSTRLPCCRSWHSTRSRRCRHRRE